MSDGELCQTMQRLMSIHDEIDERKFDLKSVYADAKSAGFDKTALGLAIRQIRGRAKAETPAAEERAAIVDLYISAFDNAPRTYVHVPAREGAAETYPARVSRRVIAPSAEVASETSDAVATPAPVADTASIPGLAEASAIAARAVVRPAQAEAAQPCHDADDLDIPAFLRRTTPGTHPSHGEQA